MAESRLRRRFVHVGNRRVHYFRAGEGPPAVLIHSSPANARLLMKEIEQLENAHTVFAFDTPGFGLSDPLPGKVLTVPDLADALAETLETLGMPACPFFGSHTGAAIALELGVRHPARVTGLVLDGVPAFTDDECERFFGTYFRSFPPSDLGGHYADVWTRFRDQSTWFPWTARARESLNAYDLSPPHSTHLWASMYWDAADHYEPAYRAASFYGARALTAIAALDVPAAFCATDTDMLHPHMARFPALKSGQAIVPIGSSYERKRALIAERFAMFGASGAAPADCDEIGSGDGIARQFVDAASGQLHLRYAGDRDAPPLLLLHDALGSSETLEPRIAELAHDFFVIAPDLPGCGESDAFTGGGDMAAYVATLAALHDRLGIDAVTVYGIGFGARVAVAFAADRPAQVTSVVVSGLPLPDAVERADMRAHYAPAIPIGQDGGHWYRTWLMVRDTEIWFPWYRPTLDNQRAEQGDFGARSLHRRTMDVMRARESHGDVVRAALDDDTARALDRLAVPLVQIVDPHVPTSAHDGRLAGSVHPAAVIVAADSALIFGVAMRLAHGFDTSRAFS